MLFTFEIKLPKDFEARMPEIQDKARANGLSIDRNGDGYSFSGFGVEGTLDIAGEIAHVTVTNRPFFFSDNMIIRTISDYLRNHY
jgi:hypothetical protein